MILRRRRRRRAECAREDYGVQGAPRCGCGAQLAALGDLLLGGLLLAHQRCHLCLNLDTAKENRGELAWSDDPRGGCSDVRSRARGAWSATESAPRPQASP